MRLASFNEAIRKAEEGNYAIGGFDFYNLETALAVMETGRELNSPVMLISAAVELELLGIARAADMVRWLSRETGIPVVLHLDHTNTFEECAKAVDAGFSSVMIDGSRLPFAENIALTKKVADYAHAKGVAVEAELGAVGRVDESTHEGADAGSGLTDPAQAATFVAETKVDALAVAIGNAHGMYTKLPSLEFELLGRLHKAVPVPLVLHGGSGTPADQLSRSIDLGIRKVNVASELAKAFCVSFIDMVGNKKTWWATAAAKAIKEVPPVVARWMRMLRAEGRGHA